MEFQFSAKFSPERILDLEKLLFEDPYGVWRIVVCFVIILVSFFWSQIFLRGLIFRSYKFEYFFSNNNHFCKLYKSNLWSMA